MKPSTWTADRIPSPLGDLFAVADEKGRLKRLDFVGSRERAADEAALQQLCGHPLRWERAPFEALRTWLEAFFRGRDLPLAMELSPDGTDFQRQVWNELLRIPAGSTRSYAELAHSVGRPGAARAVGRANATNPISLAIPCHRVIGADGSLTGYAGGMQRKEDLLELEARQRSSSNPLLC